MGLSLSVPAACSPLPCPPAGCPLCCERFKIQGCGTSKPHVDPAAAPGEAPKAAAVTTTQVIVVVNGHSEAAAPAVTAVGPVPPHVRHVSAGSTGSHGHTADVTAPLTVTPPSEHLSGAGGATGHSKSPSTTAAALDNGVAIATQADKLLQAKEKHEKDMETSVEGRLTRIAAMAAPVLRGLVVVAERLPIAGSVAAALTQILNVYDVGAARCQ